MTGVDRGVTGRQPQAVRSALAVLQEVARAGAGVTAKEVADALGLPPATTYRLLNLLVGEEYLVRLPDLHGFALGAKVAGLAGVIAPARVPTAARRVLADLRGRMRAGVHLALVAGPVARVVDVDPDLPLADPSLVETHLHASAVGHLVLAEADDWRAVVHHPDRLLALTRETPSRGEQVDACLARVRAQGWAGQSGQLHEGVGCLAVPVRGTAGQLVAALAVSSARGAAPVEHLDLARSTAEQLGPLLD
ncbi:transcriptional regulator, IclR family [Klenkia marina]|uniref:Transcriptional regulator, IclR family n=1 Tax=Klenkia marina TaxID=1960309 RepID=A0A1G4YL83_9ACTN|nr:IclR family transcriptional regulator C-terminal domain-containing protein [Klenkia marina]SCX54257.1 transcriptional regulator, IclR family [Klenkia marina]